MNELIDKLNQQIAVWQSDYRYFTIWPRHGDTGNQNDGYLAGLERCAYDLQLLVQAYEEDAAVEDAPFPLTEAGSISIGGAEFEAQ